MLMSKYLGVFYVYGQYHNNQDIDIYYLFHITEQYLILMVEQHIVVDFFH